MKILFHFLSSFTKTVALPSEVEEEYEAGEDEDYEEGEEDEENEEGEEYEEGEDEEVEEEGKEFIILV